MVCEIERDQACAVGEAPPSITHSLAHSVTCQIERDQACIVSEALCEVLHADATELVVCEVEVEERGIVLNCVRKAAQRVIAEIAI